MKKILIGCGVVALLLLLLGGGAMLYMVQTVRKQAPHAERVELFEQRMRERFGEPEEFVPPREGVDARRFALFMDVRESLRETGVPVARRIDQIAREFQSPNGKSRSFLGRVSTYVRGFRTGMGILGEGLEYVVRADSILLDVDMGRGEYLYLHLLSASSWLRWSPTELVPPPRAGEDDEGPFRRVGEDVRRESFRLFRAQLQNAARDFAERPPESDTESAWAATVEAALESARGPGGPFPAQGALPPHVLATLEGFEGRLRSMLPRSAGELLVESPLLMDIDSADGEVRIQFD
jgi:hypothetical protein